MRLGYDLTIEQTQKLTMTPELIQAIQILQYNSQELEDFVSKEIMENPILEIDNTVPNDSRENLKDPESSMSEELMYKEAERDDIDLREKIAESEYDDISYRQWEHRVSNEDVVSFDQYTSKEETLQDYLLLQLTFSDLKDRDKKIGRYLVEGIDDNGYLTVDTDQTAAAFGVKSCTVERILKVIQGFEPVGVGARSLEECLLIQLEAKGFKDESLDYVIKNHLNDLAENKIQYIAKSIGLTVLQVQAMADLIRTLDPKPGMAYSSGEQIRYVVPDVIIEKEDDGYEIVTNDSTIPSLKVSSYYVNLVKNNKDDEDLQKYLNDKYNSALWLIKSIEQRKRTIFKVSEAVMKLQTEFLEKGEKYLKPMTLKQIADAVGVHESTVSRSINGKFIQTPRGVYEIKYFFSSGVGSGSGEGLSSNSIKTFIKEIIDGEDPKKPCSDQDMVEILSEKGIEISRRTVAKYRESMNILSSSKRRRY
ncbi:MAG: RNA polymerase factor sigma-54 [Firmicutes bacterium]|nr:RNA polymerase factor sigma-54 [Bacillota bacterium]